MLDVCLNLSNLDGLVDLFQVHIQLTILDALDH